jgi:hypothetical protein
MNEGQSVPAHSNCNALVVYGRQQNDLNRSGWRQEQRKVGKTNREERSSHRIFGKVMIAFSFSRTGPSLVFRFQEGKKLSPTAKGAHKKEDMLCGFACDSLS